MDIRTIKTFQTVIKYGSFQRAAESLNYAQSTVTTHVQKLERDIGLTLLDRENNLQLTEAGELLYEKGGLLLKTFDHLESSMIELAEGDAGTVRIGVMEPMASYRLPKILTIFSKEFPKVQISLHIQGSKTLVDMVMKDEIDVAFCAAPGVNRGTVFEPMYSEEVVLLAPLEHSLGKQEMIYLKDLRNEKLVITNTLCPFRGNLERKMIETGISPQYGIEVSNMLALKYYVQSRFGVAVVPRITVESPPEGTLTKPIVDFKEGLSVGIVSKVGFQSNKPMKVLLDMIGNSKEILS